MALDCCETGYSNTYGNIVLVAAVITIILGIVDIAEGAKLARNCVYDDGILSLLMVGYGTVTIITGILFIYVLARNFEYSVFFSNITWRSFKYTIWAITVITYLIDLTLGPVLITVANGVEDTNCTSVLGYAQFRLFTTVALPFAPVVLVLAILAIFMSLVAIYCVLSCLSIGAKAND